MVHCKRSPYDVYIGRASAGSPAGTTAQWGNPFVMRSHSAAERKRVIDEYKAWLLAQPDMVARARKELKGKVLGCWCAPLPCHGHVLAAVANTISGPQVDHIPVTTRKSRTANTNTPAMHSQTHQNSRDPARAMKKSLFVPPLLRLPRDDQGFTVSFGVDEVRLVSVSTRQTHTANQSIRKTHTANTHTRQHTHDNTHGKPTHAANPTSDYATI